MSEPQAAGGTNVRRIGARSTSVATLPAAAVREALPACAATAAPIRIAIFEFELDDASAGAAPSVGVVKRISRTEYTVRFQIRDARTGAIVASEGSGLRMGADYSWNRSAARLPKDRLLENRDRQ